eukprot:g979.t1
MSDACGQTALPLSTLNPTSPTLHVSTERETFSSLQATPSSSNANLDREIAQARLREATRVHASPFSTPYLAPQPRQFWLSDGSSSITHGTPRQATANDLLIDLVLVVLLSDLSHLTQRNTGATEETTTREIRASELASIAMFYPIYNSWWLFTYHCNQFDAGDAVYFAFLLGSLSMLVLSGYSLVECGTVLDTGADQQQQQCGAFSKAVAGFRTLVCAMELWAWAHLPRALGVPCRQHAINLGVMAALWFSLGFAWDHEATSTSILRFNAHWWVVWVLDIVASYGVWQYGLMYAIARAQSRRGWCMRLGNMKGRHHAPGAPCLDLALLAERLDRLVLISLGKIVAVTGLVSWTARGADGSSGGTTGAAANASSAAPRLALVGSHHTGARASSAIALLILVLALKSLHFDNRDAVRSRYSKGSELTQYRSFAAARNARHAGAMLLHPMSVSRLHGCAYVISFGPLVLALTLIGNATQRMVTATEMSAEEAQTVGNAVATVMLLSTLQLSLHRPVVPKRAVGSAEHAGARRKRWPLYLMRVLASVLLGVVPRLPWGFSTLAQCPHSCHRVERLAAPFVAVEAVLVFAVVLLDVRMQRLATVPPPNEEDMDTSADDEQLTG